MEEPIRVAHIVGKMVGGGVEAFIMNYYRHINRDKIQFDFIIDSDSTLVPREEIESLGGRIIEIPPYQKLFKYTKELRKVFRENKYKIVHSHLNTLSVFPLYCAWREKVPIRIAHSHSTSNKKEWKKNIIKNLLRPFSNVFATNYFACTEHAGRWMFGNKEYDNGNVYILNNAIDINDFLYDENERKIKRKELGIENKFVIGHIGRFVEQKNHRFLIELFNDFHKKRADSILMLIGQGPLLTEIKEKVKKLNIDDSVLFLGQREDTNKLYQAMDLFLFPSLYEGLGIVMIEAQSSGLPCIASTEVPKVAKVNENVEFICLKDPVSKWKESIEKHIHDRKIVNINDFKNSGYSIKTEASKLEEEYFRLLKQLER